MRGLGELKVLHLGKFYPPHRGGMETHLEALCTGLSQQIQIKVLVANSTSNTVNQCLNGVPVTRLASPFQIAGASICPQMANAIREFNADLVHIHLPNPTALCAYWASGHKGRLILSYHSDVLRQKILGKLFSPIQEQILHRAAIIIVATPDYVRHSPVLSKWESRCRIIPYGINLQGVMGCNNTRVAEIRAEFGSRLVLGVGRLVSYKGFRYLIEAMKYIDGQLLLIGEGPFRKQLERQVESLGLQDRVTILGQIDDVRPYYQAADVFALPSIARTEAFGIVQLEAMIFGKPVVNTALDSGVPFVSQDGVTGITVPPKDPAALANALNMLLNNPQLAAMYGNAARERVRAEFSQEKMVQRTLDVYKTVAALSAGHPYETRERSKPSHRSALNCIFKRCRHLQPFLNVQRTF